MRTDLATLNRARAPRISADAAAARWTRRTGVPSGRPVAPRPSVRTTGDGLIPVRICGALLGQAHADSHARKADPTIAEGCVRCRPTARPRRYDRVHPTDVRTLAKDTRP